MGFKSKVKSTNTLPSLIKKLQSLDGKEAVVYYDDSEHKSSGLAISDLAAIHEFGAITDNAVIPPRPFMTQAYEKLFFDFDKMVGLFTSVVYGKGTVTRELKKLSAHMQDRLVEAIDTGEFVQLDFRTTAKKGHNIPLFETGELRRRSKRKVQDKKSNEENT
jgi:hypothetical protein